MNFFRNNKIWEEEENLNWDVIEISKVNDKIIKKLINNLKLDKSDLSDNFFISFESLLKIGKRAEYALNSYIKETKQIHNSKIDIFNFILNCIKNETIEDNLVPKLYHPDFIIRARTIFRIEEANDIKYLRFILPLLNDPDDSVRWAATKFLDSHNLIKNPLVFKELKNFINKESNPVIKQRVKEIFKKSENTNSRFP
ncbi:MAG: HEAT repeat domain-containing protein [Promethearchaeota archaeon]